jgi:transposase
LFKLVEKQLKEYNRVVLNGTFYVLLTGCRWMDMPIRYGHYSTAFRRLKRWQREGVWSRILMALASGGYSMGMLSLDRVSVDSAAVEAKKGRSF